MSLSDKIVSEHDRDYWISMSDAKEFVKKVKDELDNNWTSFSSPDDIEMAKKIIDEEAGPKLIQCKQNVTDKKGCGKSFLCHINRLQSDGTYHDEYSTCGIDEPEGLCEECR